MVRRRKKELDPDDLALWKRVARTVSPLKARAGPETVLDDQAPEPPAEQPETPSKPARPVPPAAATAPQALAKPRPAALDRKTKRRLDRGQRRAEAVIDLHGLTQRMAHDRLLGFLRSSQAQGLRVVLVVTGKGRPQAIEERDWWDAPAGILRRSVPHWLETPPFRDLVSAYESPVHRKGGEGALYIQIRRRKG
ncbi:Smr/MutS family protein [Lutibaculum baratangense]|uniref:Smr protein/MutS2 n=1 Tax=Lutibaculum baratangense AMV1 TaxID=631454 RepID=V4R276_9HYPH|nr:Smr/MutS family protein [Lutibaculum baratangense]ESR26047.1 Smr protein/MutS2 [Lutibaculum baratangense AMV1]